MRAKLTFPARKAQASRLWRIADAICQSSVLRMLPVSANITPNRPVIRWMLGNFSSISEAEKGHGFGS